MKSQYMLLMRATDWDKGLSAEEAQDGLIRMMAWIEDLRLEGALLAGQPLFPEGRVISANKSRAVADGPFVESKEAVGGYLLVEADHLEAAVEIAKACPTLPLGLVIEVRPVAGQCPIADRADFAETAISG